MRMMFSMPACVRPALMKYELLEWMNAFLKL